MQSELLNKILHTNYLEESDIDDFEIIRKNLRDLIKYIPKIVNVYMTDFDDDILSVNWNESDLENDDLQNYKDKLEYYIKQHQEDNPVIMKLKENKPLDKNDMDELEKLYGGS